MNTFFEDMGFVVMSFGIFGLILSCSNPTSFHEAIAVNSTPEAVIQNLIFSYNSRNLDKYLSNFSEDCQFRKNSEFLWGISQEEQIHERLFASVNEVDLKLEEITSEQVTEKQQVIVYSYELSIKLPTEQVLLANGRVQFEFMRDVQERWRIQSFREIKDQFSKSEKAVSTKSTTEDSVDYFPLQVGNKWIYQDLVNPNFPDFEVNVTDSSIIHGNLYFHLDRFPFVTDAFYRVDSLQQLNLFMPSDSSELTIYKFTAGVGDSWSVHLPGDPDSMIVELTSRKDSLAVPAGTFTDVLEFLITDFNSGARFICEFSADVGLIRQTGENQVLELKGARVNGNEIGVVTGIKNESLDWTQIKEGFK